MTDWQDFKFPKVGSHTFFLLCIMPFILYPALIRAQTPVPLSSLSSVYVRGFRLVGNTVFSEEELSEIISPYINRKITAEELQTLRRTLTEYYIQEGYVSSGVIIPDQKMTDGVITLRVIEGKLTDVVVQGNRFFHSGYFADRLKMALQQPLNVADVQEALQPIDRDERIKRVNARLVPGVLPGEGILDIHIEEEIPYTLDISVSNHQSPSVGAIRTQIHGAHQSLTGNGDVFEGTFGFTEGLDDLEVAYSFPVTVRDTILKMVYKESDTLVVEEPFNDLDIKSKEKTYRVRLGHPFYRNKGREFSLSVTLDFRNSETYLLGMPFPFSEGSDNGKTKLEVFRFGQQWTTRGPYRTFIAHSCLSMGIDSFGSTPNNQKTDGKFLAWLGQMKCSRRMNDWGAVMMLRMDAQLSNDPLLPIEKFAIGGMQSVRGYRKNRLVRDNGFAASMEWQVPIIQREKSATVHCVPFLDFGRSWNTDTRTPDPKTLWSIGIGFEFKFRHLHLQVYGGLPLRRIHLDGDDLQDKGIHFEIKGSFFD